MLAWLGCFFAQPSYAPRTARLASSFLIAILGRQNNIRPLHFLNDLLGEVLYESAKLLIGCATPSTHVEVLKEGLGLSTSLHRREIMTAHRAGGEDVQVRE